MATTYSGRLVMPTNYGVPTALDLAVHLGREWRWAGAVRQCWTVLHHVHSMMSLASALMTDDGGPAPSDIRLAVLLHDAHEAVLRDVPSTWKTEEQRAQERRLDARLYDCYAGLPGGPAPGVRGTVKYLDFLLVQAEGNLLGPPGCMRHAGLERTHDAKALRKAEEAVQHAMKLYPSPEDSIWPESPLVLWYVAQLKAVVPPARWEAYG